MDNLKEQLQEYQEVTGCKTVYIACGSKEAREYMERKLSELSEDLPCEVILKDAYIGIDCGVDSQRVEELKKQFEALLAGREYKVRDELEEDNSHIYSHSRSNRKIPQGYPGKAQGKRNFRRFQRRQ